MGGVARQEDAALGVVRHLAFVDAEVGQPHRVDDTKAASGAPVHHGLDLGERRGRGLGCDEVGLADRRDDARPAARDREDHEGSVAVQVDGELVARRFAIALKADVGQHPVVALGRTAERDVQSVPDRAMGAVAADQPGRPHGLFASVGMAKARVDVIAAVGEARQLHLAFHNDPQRLEVLVQEALGVALPAA